MVKGRHEQEAEAALRAIKKGVIARLGRKALSDEDISIEGHRCFGRRWQGVFRQSQWPGAEPNRFAVLNTATSPTTPGSHWVACYTSPSGTTYLWDSFGRNTNALLHAATQKVVTSGAGRVVGSDRDAQQRGSSEVCGQLCIAWLLLVRDQGTRVARLV